MQLLMYYQALLQKLIRIKSALLSYSILKKHSISLITIYYICKIKTLWNQRIFASLAKYLFIKYNSKS